MTPNQNISKAQLALMYGIAPSTLYNWLKLCGFYVKFPLAKRSKILKPIEIAFIYEKIGEPENKGE